MKIHHTAIIDEGASIGKNTKVWHWTHICKNAKIGANCSIGQNVFIGNNVQIGNNVKIQNNISVYDNVTLEEDVFCGPSIVFTNVMNPRSHISRKNEYQNTLVKRGASIGANATIICGNIIGEYAFIGAGCVVNRDIKPYEKVVGVPAMQIGWISAFGESINLPLKGSGTWVCPHTGDIYKLEVDKIIKVQ